MAVRPSWSPRHNCRFSAGGFADLVKASTAVSPRCVASAQGAYAFHTSPVAEMRKKQTICIGTTSSTSTTRQPAPVTPVTSFTGAAGQ